MAINVLETLIGRDWYRELALACAVLLAEASARAANPIDGRGVWVPIEGQFKLAAAELLLECGLLRRVDGTRCFIITDLGLAAVDRLEKIRSASLSF